jgi:alanyl-tRNA synthetase
MFEMLGNWSFGDYYKKEAIEWAWELLTEVYKIPKENLYVTYFEGDEEEGLAKDEEAKKLWENLLPDAQILPGNKKDNFWEMGETGPCGPCSEIHVDIRPEAEKKKIKGSDLVNNDHPEVIEIWNLVFMEMNRLANKSLVPLPKKHIDTGMGFERLAMVIQGKRSNYDTDVFMPLINKLEKISGKKYTQSDSKEDIAFRVIADHIRAITFTIADGQLPSNTGAGYVIRRILRRAIRFSWQFLHIKEPYLFKLVDTLVDQLGDVFENLGSQEGLVKNVLLEEEESFIRTLEQGIKRIDHYFNSDPKEIDGKFAFELYDTFGFPIDLTALIAKEFGLGLDLHGFENYLNEQKERSRAASIVAAGDWINVRDDEAEEFIGYDYTDGKVKITRYREVKDKNKTRYQLVFDFTPFYPEGGGQVGDVGLLISEDEQRIKILDTKKENGVIIHITEQLPKDIKGIFRALVNSEAREAAESNHSATHLLHRSLRHVLGKHVEQKGSLVAPTHLRFDFSHFSKLTDEELSLIEREVNDKIRQNISLSEHRNVPMQKALDMGAMALFGEKYGDLVRVIKFDNSIELCGGTHVSNTAKIGRFKIISESAIAAGVRRIEAITSYEADRVIDKALAEYENVRTMLKVKSEIAPVVSGLMDENHRLRKEVEQLNKFKIQALKQDLLDRIETIDGLNVLKTTCELEASGVKDLAFQLKDQFKDLFIAIGNRYNDKPGLTIAVGADLLASSNIDAGKIIREAAKHIQGGGGGQPFFAQAGGKNLEGVERSVDEALAIALKSR